MPYTVRSQCTACGGGDEFSIGNWPVHLGVYVCPACKALVNVPLETSHCPGCGSAPRIDQFYDYARAVPYLGRQSPGEGEAGPPCPRCEDAPLTFATRSHDNFGRLGQRDDGRRPWAGRDYMEKAIFFYALVAVSAQWQLAVPDLLSYYNLDMPDPKGPNAGLYAGRRLSMPVLFDIRNHLVAGAMVGGLTFAPSPAMQAEIQQRARSMGLTAASGRRWWEFWK